MKKIRFFLLVLVLLSFTGCYYTRNVLLIDKDEKVKNLIDISNSGLHKDFSKDIKTQLEFFLNTDDYIIESEEQYISLELKGKKDLSSFKYIKQEESNGIKTIKVKIPPMVSYFNEYAGDSGEYQGTFLNFQISLAKEFEIIDANSFDIESYKSEYDKKEYTKVVWDVPTAKLSKGVELTVRYKLKK